MFCLLSSADSRLPASIEAFVQNLLSGLNSVLLILIVFPWFLVPLAVFTAIFFFFSRTFRCGMRDLKRIENTSRSPVYSHLSTTISGLSIIHAFKKEHKFVTQYVFQHMNYYFQYFS